MDNGWIMLHRKIKESSIWTDSQAVHLWLTLLLNANHAENEFLQNGSLIKVKRGQVLTGRKSLSAETGINESKIQRLLKVFEKCHMIEQLTNNRSRLISILNYDQYQAGEQPTNNQRTTDEQPVNTNNNVNNYNNKNYNRNEMGDESPKKKTIQEKKEDFKNEVKEKWKSLGGESYLPINEARAFYNYWSETKMRGRQMKCEKQETFEIGNRLATWKKNIRPTQQGSIRP